MPTITELLKNVEAELNAVKAADMGMEAAQAFAAQAKAAFDGGDADVTKGALNNLVSLLDGLRTAIPANVVPASAGPVGKTPHEQYLEQASDAVKESLDHMQSTLKPIRDVLASISDAVEKAMTATAVIQSVPQDEASLK
jgi:hypothetical protein